jgi:hypothetical protein
MKKLLVLLSGLAGLLFTTAVVAAEKEVTLTGDVTCAHCMLKLKQAKTCQIALQVKDGNKLVSYFVTPERAVEKEWNKQIWEKQKINICEQRVEAMVAGKVKEIDGKLVLIASRMEQKTPPKN